MTTIKYFFDDFQYDNGNKLIPLQAEAYVTCTVCESGDLDISEGYQGDFYDIKGDYKIEIEEINDLPASCYSNDFLTDLKGQLEAFCDCNESVADRLVECYCDNILRGENERN